MGIIPQLIINSIITGSVYALASSGLSLTYGLLKIINFAHGHIMMTGAYIFYLFFILTNLTLPTSMLLTLLSMAILTWIIIKIFIAPFINNNIFLVFVTTIALSTILESLVSLIFDVNAKPLSKDSALITFYFLGAYITPIQIAIIASTIVLLSLLAFIIHHTSIGRKIRSISYNPHASEALGVNKNFIINCTIIAGALLACFAGILIGLETSIQPTMGNSYTIKAFAIMILGGLGNIWGTIAGSYILGFIENIATGINIGSYSIPVGYKDAFAFVIILITLIFKPSGLFMKEQRTA